MFFLFFVFDFSSVWNAFFIVIFAALHFAPIKFVYPSQASKFKTLTLINTAIFIGSCVVTLWIYPERNDWWIGSIILTTGYYAMMAIYNTWIEI